MILRQELDYETNYINLKNVESIQAQHSTKDGDPFIISIIGYPIEYNFTVLVANSRYMTNNLGFSIIHYLMDNINIDKEIGFNILKMEFMTKIESLYLNENGVIMKKED